MAAQKPGSLAEQLSNAAANANRFSEQEIEEANRAFKGQRGYPEHGFPTNTAAFVLSEADLKEIAAIWERRFLGSHGDFFYLKTMAETNAIFAKAIFPAKYLRGQTEVYFFKQSPGVWECWGEMISRYD